jgi:hypothetical protein
MGTYLDTEEIGTMPGREEHRLVLTVTTPPVRVAWVLRLEGLSMVAGNGEERVGVRGRECLDLAESPDQVLQDGGILLSVILVDNLLEGKTSADHGEEEFLRYCEE